MAWTKEIMAPDTGVVVQYREMLTIFYEHTKQMSTLRVGGWVNQEAFNQDREPVIIKTYFLPSGLAPQLADGAKNFVTEYAMAQEELEWAEVVVNE
jgi:hypothetical protein